MRRGGFGPQRGFLSAGCGASAPTPRKPVVPIRVDITMWFDDLHSTDIHIHEDAEGDGPIVRFSDLTNRQQAEIAKKFARWTYELDAMFRP